MRSVDKSMVPAVTVPRLALYLRKLRELQARGVQTHLVARSWPSRIDLNAAQIRKDFSYFGEFGVRGVGYDVPRLIGEITKSPGPQPFLERHHRRRRPAGHRARALQGLLRAGLPAGGRCSTARPRSSARATDRARCATSAELEEFCAGAEQPVDIAIITVPAHAAQATIDRVVAPTVGVTAILNFAPVKVFTPKDVIVRQVDLSSELMFLSFYLDREQAVRHAQVARR